MGRSQETFGKKEVRNRKEKKRKEKAEKRAIKKTEGKKTTFEDMIAYVDEFGKISSTPPDADKRIPVSAETIELTATRNKPENKQGFLRKGVITYFSQAKNFGFIRDLDSGERVFLHSSNLLEPVEENSIVEYEMGKGPRGASANKVKLFREKPE